MARRRIGILTGLIVTVLCSASTLLAITINIDYTYDTNNFFGTGNPDGPTAGAQARASLEAAAANFTAILNDSFTSIQTPDPFFSATFNGLEIWSWTMTFTQPTTGEPVSLVDQTIQTDEYRIYAGARSLSGNTLGIGGPGGFGWNSNPFGGFTSAESTQLNQITADFSNAVETRGETSGFANWGGAVTFDRDATTTWHYDHTTPPTSGSNDFFSVATHELAHALGFGASQSWNDWVTGTVFTGPNAASEYGGDVPLDCDLNGCSGHWAEGTDSVVLGTSMAQETAMDPKLTTGTRKRLTALDAAGLADLGWSLVAPAILEADFDRDGDVDDADLVRWKTYFGGSALADADGDGDSDGADFLFWQRQFGSGASLVSTFASVPEPSSGWLLLLGSACLIPVRKPPVLLSRNYLTCNK